MDVASECGGGSRQWFNVFSKLEEKDKLEKTKMIDRTCVEMSDFVRIFQHKTSRELRVTGVVGGPG